MSAFMNEFRSHLIDLRVLGTVSKLILHPVVLSTPSVAQIRFVHQLRRSRSERIKLFSVASVAGLLTYGWSYNVFVIDRSNRLDPELKGAIHSRIPAQQ